MSVLSRIGVAIDSNLLKKFDSLIASRGYTNRSEAFRDLIRDELVQKSWEGPDTTVVGTVTLVYDHHVRLLNEKLTEDWDAFFGINRVQFLKLRANVLSSINTKISRAME